MEVIFFFCANGVIQSKILENKTILCLGDISKDFTVNNMEKKQGQMDMCIAFLLTIILLTLAISGILIYI